ncbi:MAG: BatD family protein [Gammaproteobacteria bacterium]|nr:BatD family protein [Gammaproteobacteria bacterium]
MSSAALRYSAAAALASLLALAQPASAASLRWSTSSEALHADMPFTLTLSAQGLEEEPVPEAPVLEIDGCEVVFIGVDPSVASRIEIINGRRSEWRDVTFHYRWRVTATKAGRYTVPAQRIEQAGVEARVGAAGFEVREVPETDDMVVRLSLPQRAVWVGETFDATVEWLLAKDVDSYEFAVPLFDVDGVQVQAAGGGGESVLFTAGAQQIRLPLRRAEVREGGRTYTGFSFPARITLASVGTLELAPVRVVARLQSGTTRDAFGFRRPRYELFRAQGERQRLTVRPLPQAGRPPTFVNAIGEGFAIDVRASRTVVSVGEPIELVVSLRGAPPLTGLSLPPLDGPGALPATQFGVPEGSLAGTVDEETGTKRFPVTVRIRSAEVREIPSLAFSYFDPRAGEYRTVHSEPIAVSVGAGQLVGAADVVAAPVAERLDVTAGSPGEADAGGIATLLGAEMAISDPMRTFARPWGSDGVGFWLGGLYGVPILVALASLWLRRTQGRRGRARIVRGALAAVESALDATLPAREAAPVIAGAVRRLAMVSGADAHAANAVLARVENRAFDPSTAQQPLGADDMEELRALARTWAGKGSAASSSVAATAGLLVAVALAPGVADAAEDLAAARDAYQAALAETDRLRRVRLFEQAADALRPAALSNPAAPELQVDWGNAALGAQDRGWAVLAWRRALHADPANDRASRNLTWVRDRLPVWLPRPASSGALDSLMFWRNRLTAAQLLVVGGVGFALAVLVLVPWRGRPPPWRRAIAVLAAGLWFAATASALLVASDGDAAVVVLDGATLRSADSVGASPTYPNPLPAGTEVTVVEDRATWLRVALADGTQGWLSANGVARVDPR